eukprot:scaffold75_cov165-Amphora_coffeaeformis.AAC.21
MKVIGRESTVNNDPQDRIKKQNNPLPFLWYHSMMPLLQSSICFLNDNIVTIYATLIAFALLSQVGTVLPNMVRHGKLRNIRLPPRKKSRGGDFWTWMMEGDVWMVKKQRFLHFYVLGAVALMTVRAATSEPLIGSSQTLAQALLLLHIIRRVYECLYVHRWLSMSVMHLSIYVFGLLYYALLPFIFCRFDCGAGSRTSLHKVSEDVPRVVRLPFQVASFILCLYAQHQQARHHLILANLRHGDNGKVKRNKVSSSSSAYRLPEGGWFHWVACPHYLAEILFYVGLAGLLHDSARGIVIVTWVVVSLTLNALHSQRWYEQNIPGYAKLKRKAIFPFLL